MIDRHKKILEIVNANGKIEVSYLSKELGVSQVTIRKDLSLLEKKGLLTRQHGFALIINSDDISKRLAFNYDVKRRIALSAASIVEDGETVMIESGSTCALLAKELAENKRNVTIITNSAFIASYIRECPYANVILLGGNYQKESQVLVGPIISKCIEGFHVDKLFVGTDGFTEKSHFTAKNYMRAETVKVMAENANKVIILTESKKFSQQGVVSQFNIKDVYAVITDNKIPEKAYDLLVKNNVNVITVDAE